MIIDVIVKNKIKHSHQLAYYSPDPIPIGCRVEVMLQHKQIVGFVIGCREDAVTPYQLLPIVRVLDEASVLSSTMLSLFAYLQHITYASTYDVLLQCLPVHKRLSSKVVEPSKVKVLRRTAVACEPTEKNALLHSLKPNACIPYDAVNASTRKKWQQQGYVETVLKLKSIETNPNPHRPVLSDEQLQIVNAIDVSKFHVHALKGPTGSGKTHVFMALAEKVLAMSMRVLVCVPEISLTPHMIERFRSSFSVPVFAYHSTLSLQDKVTQVAHIQASETCIVIATRSGLFIDAAFGIIIIDEEHDASFYQTAQVAYHAHDVAHFLAKRANIPLVLASATLSLETYAKALKGVYQLHVLHARFNASMPTLHIVNMRDEILKKRAYMFSTLLLEAVQQRLQRKEQVLILINRRGSFPTLTCNRCLTQARCRECGLMLNYHSDTHTTHCHYCVKVSQTLLCEQCGCDEFEGSGYGTQSVVTRLKQLFPNARIDRLDSDSVTSKVGQSLLTQFKQQEIDILVGTSLISKGIDIESVTCVGILEADHALSFLNLRSAESTFAMLMQAAGRSGRANKHGEVFVQVMDDSHRVIQCLKTYDYNRFFKEEMAFRHLHQLPPYVYMIAIEIAHAQQNDAFETAIALTYDLKATMHVIGPSVLLKQRQMFRYQIIIKTKNWEETLQALKVKQITQSKCEIQVIVNPYALGGL